MYSRFGVVRTNDLGELGRSQEGFEQPAFTTAEIQDSGSLTLGEYPDHGSDALVCQWLGSFLILGRSVFSGLDGCVVGEPYQRLVDEALAVFEIAARDELALRMCLQPTCPPRDQLVYLVVPDPVVLAVVEGGNEYVEVGEQLGQPLLAGQGDVAVSAARSVCVWRIDRDFIAEGLEQFVHQRFAFAPEGRELGGKRKGLPDQFRPLGATAAECAPEDPGNGHTEKGRADVRPIVDVVRQHRAATAHQGDGVDVEQERGGAAFLGRLRIEHVRLAEGQLEHLRPRRVLVQQVAEVRRGAMRGGEGEQHGSQRELLRG